MLGFAGKNRQLGAAKKQQAVIAAAEKFYGRRDVRVPVSGLPDNLLNGKNQLNLARLAAAILANPDFTEISQAEVNPRAALTHAGSRLPHAFVTTKKTNLRAGSIDNGEVQDLYKFNTPAHTLLGFTSLFGGDATSTTFFDGNPAPLIQIRRKASPTNPTEWTDKLNCSRFGQIGATHQPGTPMALAKRLFELTELHMHAVHLCTTADLLASLNRGVSAIGKETHARGEIPEIHPTRRIPHGRFPGYEKEIQPTNGANELFTTTRPFIVLDTGNSTLSVMTEAADDPEVNVPLSKLRNGAIFAPTAPFRTVNWRLGFRVDGPNPVTVKMLRTDSFNTAQLRVLAEHGARQLSEVAATTFKRLAELVQAESSESRDALKRQLPTLLGRDVQRRVSQAVSSK